MTTAVSGPEETHADDLVREQGVLEEGREQHAVALGDVLAALVEDADVGGVGRVLGEQAAVGVGAATRLIDRLERAGYARRTPDPTDRRRVRVEPVPDALARVEEVVGPARRRLAEVLAHYTPDQRALIFDYFIRGAPAFRAATEEIRAAAPRRRTRSTG
ncbi:MarR family winged helix-turn-helix transcriptional regulator [Streptomyces cinerochromogenes]|uniref:MarR family winged helix-turn-helix transcriptional regulator n=1 Tax=Streptomyces cinerochromogenes TaxID=66422 RepID=UPI0036900080